MVRCTVEAITSMEFTIIHNYGICVKINVVKILIILYNIHKRIHFLMNVEFIARTTIKKPVILV